MKIDMQSIGMVQMCNAECSARCVCCVCARSNQIFAASEMIKLLQHMKHESLRGIVTLNGIHIAAIRTTPFTK